MREGYPLAIYASVTFELNPTAGTGRMIAALHRAAGRAVLSALLGADTLRAKGSAMARRAEWKKLRDDTRGALMLEYIVLVGFVAIVSIPALLFCGLSLMKNFVFVRNYALYPFP